MAKIVVNKEIIGDVCVLRPCGYVDEKGGAVLFETAEQALGDGAQKILINLYL